VRFTVVPLFALSAALLLGALILQSGSFTDFTSYYAAGRIIATGHRHELYSLRLQMQQQAEINPSSFLPFAHPAVEAVLFLPLSFLPYRTAFVTWGAANLFLIGLVGYVVRNWLKGVEALPVIAATACPLLAGLAEGQDHVVLLLTYTAAFLYLMKKREVIGGCALGLGLLRFQLTLPLLLLLLPLRRWKALGAATATGMILLLGSFGLVGWHLLPDHWAILRFVAIQHDARSLEHMPCVRGLLANLYRGNGLSILTAALSLGVLGWGLRTLHLARNASPDIAFSLAVILSLVLDYHAFLYELSALVVPAVILVRDRQASTLLKVIAGSTLVLLVYGGRFGWLVPFIMLLAKRGATLLRSELKITEGADNFKRF
jgi:hypothetical protein